MDKFIAFCGLDCKKCEARIATINNDNNLRKSVAEKWSKLNNVTITPEMINCNGCRIDGLKTIYCSNLCEIRKCAIKHNYETCENCNKLNSCNKVKMIIGNNKEAENNLKANKNVF